MDRIAILGFLITSTSPCPIVPANAILAEERRVPAGSASCPMERFSALLRMYPVLAGPLIVTLSPSTSVSSTITIASAPAGSGAPVMILHAWPEVIAGGVSPPVWLIPIIVNSAPGLWQSEAITANPSIAELSNLGSSTFDAGAGAKILPLAASNEIVSVCFGNGYCRANSIARSRETPFSMVGQTPPR